jgi:hypothetical protein
MAHQATEIVVPSWEVEGLDLAPGEQLTSVEGVVWITSSEDGRDIILGPGESVAFNTSARAIVGGFKGRSVKVSVASPTRH